MVTSLCSYQIYTSLASPGDPPACWRRRAAGPGALSPSSAGPPLARPPARCPGPSCQPRGCRGRPARPRPAACPRCCGTNTLLARDPSAWGHLSAAPLTQLHPENPGSQVWDVSVHKHLSVSAIFPNVSDLLCLFLSVKENKCFSFLYYQIQGRAYRFGFELSGIWDYCMQSYTVWFPV